MEKLLNKESVKRVKEFINNFDSNLEIIVLESAARTAKEASSALKCETGAIVKSLLLKLENNFLICLVSGDKKCSLNKLKKILKEKNICLASAEEVKINKGFSIGGVAPIAHKKKINIIIDESLKRFKNVFAAAGHPNCVFKIEYNQLIKITNGTEKEISE